MLSKRTTLLLIYLIACYSLLAQAVMEPVNLGENINSEYDEINPVISPDGSTLFFTRVNHPENFYGKWDSEDIWYAEKQSDGSWSEAKRFSQFNVARYNAILSISSDGNTLLLNGVYNRRGNFWKKRGLSIATKTNDGWGKPKALKVKGLKSINEGLHSNAYLSADGQHLVMSLSREYNSRRSDIYVSHLKHGRKWSRVKRMKHVNSAHSEESPFLSADNKYLYFSSDIEKKGKHDLYKAEAKNSKLRRWKEIDLLPEPINSAGWESYFKTNAKGSVAYYSTNTNSLGGADIFKIRLFEELDYVLLKGSVVDAKTKKPITGVAFSILLDSQRVDTEMLAFNMDSATYSAKLPFGKKYTLIAEAEGFTGVPLIADLSKIDDHQEMRRDLGVNTITYVLISGRLLDSETGAKIPQESNPTVLVNSQNVDSLKIDHENGTYEIRLPYGQQYNLQIVADNYQSDTIPLDLTKVSYYQKITKDLYSRLPTKPVVADTPVVVEEPVTTLEVPVQTIPIVAVPFVLPTPGEVQPITGYKAFVTGRIIDIATKSVFSDSQPVLFVDGVPAPKGAVSPDGVYELRLDLGKAYTLHAEKSGYYAIYDRVDLSKDKSGIVRYDLDVKLAKVQSNKPIPLNMVFESGKADITPESILVLTQLLEFLNANASISIKVEGHTDNQGGAQENLKLSRDRAKAVRDYLVKQGISPKRVSYEGFGETKAIAHNNSYEGRAQNRRVEFRIIE